VKENEEGQWIYVHPIDLLPILSLPSICNICLIQRDAGGDPVATEILMSSWHALSSAGDVSRSIDPLCREAGRSRMPEELKNMRFGRL